VVKSRGLFFFFLINFLNLNYKFILLCNGYTFSLGCISSLNHF
jgi:hypothetical protein